jgi:hypothetical protein|tara:strand:- start:1173 stop:1487 length:315 start_codon:yes stop_codon:yes gene_type:complete
MNKTKLHTIHLPNLKPTAELPPVLAATLKLIINGPRRGISTPELQKAGIISVSNNVARLKKRGAIIHAERRFFADQFGQHLPGIAHYTYLGWVVLNILDQDIEA